MEAQQIYNHVSERYSAASRGTAARYGHAVAKAFGYTDQELEGIPKESNLGLSCGNPMAMATIREGETVIDLGSGAGFDAFLAANKVGPTGKVIGVDMNKDMLRRANEIKRKHQRTNVEFVESQITDISALPSDTADVIISNCVVNLVPEAEKHLVFQEIYRLLKPGGRVAISDILAKKPLPASLRANMALYVGCVAGASLVGQYQQYLREAGFAAESVVIQNDEADLNVYMETNPDGTRTAGGKGGNLCCNPRVEGAPAQTAASTSCCPNGNAQPAADAAASASSTSSCCKPQKKETDAVGDTAAAAAAAAATTTTTTTSSSSSCCGGSASKDQPCAFDEKDLADLEGEDLNDWAGSYKIYAVKV